MQWSMRQPGRVYTTAATRVELTPCESMLDQQLEDVCYMSTTLATTLVVTIKTTLRYL